jgi:hypothetical protein
LTNLLLPALLYAGEEREDGYGKHILGGEAVDGS